MNKNLILFFGFAMIFLFGIVHAASDKDNAQEVSDEQIAKNMTYGQCVSENAEIKNSCYASVKGTLSNCKAEAEQNAKNKDAVKQCNQNYKKDKKECKSVFKASKNECKKIKHNFLETLRHSLK